MEVQVWYSAPVACHVDTDTGEVVRVVVIDELLQLDTDLEELQKDCGYSPDEDCSVDDLIAYKDALEERVYADGVTLRDYSGPAPKDIATKAREIAESADWVAWEFGD